ncbi:MAG: ABC transporter ATP-binding protein [Anaerovoracaceae bacterium]
MIEVRNLIKKYGNHLALDNLSFSVEENQIFGFLGPNGAGKSTTMNIITGYLAPTSGQVLIDGHDIVEDPVAAKRCIGYLPELPPVYMDMTPYEYLKFVGKARGIEKNRLEEEIRRAAERTSIVDVQHRLIKTLSKGYRQRVGMAQAILGDPQVIILDEPTVGLDPMQIIEFRELVKELGKNHTVILSSHILAEISEICQKIMIISKGKLIAIDTPDNLSHQLDGGMLIAVQVRECDGAHACSLLRELNDVESVSQTEAENGRTVIEVKGNAGCTDLKEQISICLMEGKCPVLSIEEQELSLEDIFIRLLERRQ